MDVIAKKKFGQNFLVNQQAKDRMEIVIQNFLQKVGVTSILEIGPGLGDLTAITSKYLKVTAVEIDPEMVEKTKDIFENEFKAKLYLGDFYQWQKEIIGQSDEKGLKNNSLDINSIDTQPLNLVNNKAGAGRDSNNSDFLTPTVVPPSFIDYYLKEDWAMVANLPYNLGSRILVDLAVARPDVSFLVLLQEEVVNKLCSLDRSFTFFGAWLNLFWDFKKVMIFPRHYFMPQPKIVSALVSAYPKEELAFLNTVQNRNEALFLLKNLFGLPSKTILNNLRNIGWEVDRIDKLLEKLGLEKSARLNKDNYVPILHQILCVDKE
jgi:16S rRNA A1518/A1519 N6-dimethyltransferase RsmA/KsgA/DIM1 with predicted DNA glycosylase/AP lyase activity